MHLSFILKLKQFQVIRIKISYFRVFNIMKHLVLISGNFKLNFWMLSINIIQFFKRSVNGR